MIVWAGSIGPSQFPQQNPGARYVVVQHPICSYESGIAANHDGSGVRKPEQALPPARSEGENRDDRAAASARTRAKFKPAGVELHH